MGKELSEMSLEELWRLFPVFLTEHKECWADWYAEEEQWLTPLLPSKTSINHIGSTAVPGIWAKPIIDILVETPEKQNFLDVKETLVRNGYICMKQSSDRLSFNKGYTADGFADRVFHLHLRHDGDHDELYFRDYLRDFPDVAARYEKLKRQLGKEFEHDRDGYTDAKSDFIRKYTSIAKSFYRNR